YEEAWGKIVWKTPLSDDQKQTSILKHTNFYRVIDALISKLESKFNLCIVYDIHSYNYKREGRYDKAPVVNLGTFYLDTERFNYLIDAWISELSKIMIDEKPISVKKNVIFYGRGYLVRHITDNFNNTLVLPTEIKKIYVDENTGEIYPDMVNLVKKALTEAILAHSLLLI
ncbi:MAG: N-formylglutamate amidohydrolase, partial [Vampirovibrionia bacterium]